VAVWYVQGPPEFAKHGKSEALLGASRWRSEAM
jgi:hypothetical protein